MRSSAMVPKLVIYAKCPLICLLASIFFTKWFCNWSLRLFKPTGFMLGFALFSTYFKMLSCFDITFNIFIVFYVFRKVFSNSNTSLTPPITITLLRFIPPLNSIVLSTKARISSEPKLYPMILINWKGNNLWII